MRLNRVLLAAAAAAALALSACDGGGGDVTTTPSSTESVSAPTEEAPLRDAGAPAPAPEVADATRGGTLTVLGGVAPPTLDPTAVADPASAAMLTGLVTRTLTQYVYDPESQTMVLVPDMASGLGQPNASYTSWTFRLRAGLRYSNGKPVRARDVAYAIKRSFETDEQTGAKPYMEKYLAGGASYDGPDEDGPDFKGVSFDGRSVTINLGRPFHDMAYLASFPQFTAVPRSADSDHYARHPLATGPYKVASYRPASHLTLVQNPYWDPATDTARHQYVERWRFTWGHDQERVDKRLVEDHGSAQTALALESILAEDYDDVRQQASDRLVRGTRPCTQVWAIDMHQIRKRAVRKALGYAYPYRKAARAAGEIPGVTWLPGTAVLPPGTAGRLEYDTLGTEGKKARPGRSRALLKQAGETGFKVSWLFRTDNPTDVALKDRLVEALRAGGFRPNPVATTASAYGQELFDADGRQDVRAETWCTDWPTGSGMLPKLWDRSLAGAPGSREPALFEVKDVQDALRRIMDSEPGRSAYASWGALDKHIARAYYPAVVTGYPGVALLRGSQVGGMSIDSVHGTPTYKTMYVVQ